MSCCWGRDDRDVTHGKCVTRAVLVCAVLLLGSCDGPWMYEPIVEAPTPDHDMHLPLGSGLPVFPEAQGFGVTTPAGRGGTVYRVTNLSDSGAGSLRAALQAVTPGVVIFEVSGTILLSDHLRITNPYITVAGQTAPPPGITLRGAGLLIHTHDVLVQHLRIRVGDAPSGPSPNNRDGLGVYGDSVYNVVVDHVSVSWAVDENASSSTSGMRHDITISNSIISEALSHSLHSDGEHSKGLLLGQGTKDFAVVGSLLLHNRDRNPYQKGDTRVLFANNVIYNWGLDRAVKIDGRGINGPSLATLIGNVFLRGIDSESGQPINISSSVRKGSGVYLSDNSEDRVVPADPWQLVDNEAGSAVVLLSPPVWTDITVRAVDAVEASVLAGAGARPADRDAVDRRLVQEVASGTGRIIDSPNEVGAWPELEHHVRPLSLPPNPEGDDDGDGYTNLEEWLHEHARVVGGTIGFNDAPTAAFTEVVTELTVAFTDQSSDPDGTIASWSWAFGDGATSSSQHPSHTYAAAGTYTVSLTVTDDLGAPSTTSHGVTVTASNHAPTAAFTWGCLASTCYFTDASSDPDGQVKTRSWDFGDGVTSTEVHPVHSYANADSYTVTLVVADPEGATGSAAAGVSVALPTMTASASGFKERGRHVIDVTWNGAASLDVAVYRNGVLIATVPNSGSYRDETNNRGQGAYMYQICESGSVSRCSGVAAVTL